MSYRRIMASAIFSLGTYRSSPVLESERREGSEKAVREEAPVPRVRLLLLTVGFTVGGTEGQILEVASRLNPEKFDVIVCGLKGADVISEELSQRGIRVEALGGKQAWDIRVMFKLARLIREVKPDIIHAFLFWANFVSRIIGRFKKVPILISSYRDAPLWSTPSRRVVDRLTVNWVDSVTCCSEAVRQLAVSTLGGNSNRYRTIHNGVEVARFSKGRELTRSQLGLNEALPTVGTVCRLFEPKKGLSVLLQAVGQLVRENPTHACQLLVVGEGPALTQLQGLANRLGIAHLVIFAGVQRKVEQVLPLLDVFVLPSLYEGFGIAIIEAMAAGCPVIASEVGGIPEIVTEETGLLVPPGDVGALAGAIRALLNNPETSRAFGVAGQRRAQTCFSIDRMVQEHERLYMDLYENRFARREAQA